MIIFDASFLIAYLHPNPEPPMDRNNQPVSQFRERVNHLVATLNATDQLIGVPTPALAEILVRAGNGKYRYLATIGDSYRFEVLPFDQLSAIDAGELIEQVKSENKSQPLATWAKVKFDVQIAAIAKTAEATIIYSDDGNIEAHGKRLNIPVKRVCDLPLPPPEKPKSTAVEADRQQGALPLGPSIEEQDKVPTATPQDIADADPQEATQPADKPSNKLEAAPAHPAPVQGTNGGRAQGEAATKAKAHQEGGLGEDGS